MWEDSREEISLLFLKYKIIINKINFNKKKNEILIFNRNKINKIFRIFNQIGNI